MESRYDDFSLPVLSAVCTYSGKMAPGDSRLYSACARATSIAVATVTAPAIRSCNTDGVARARKANRSSNASLASRRRRSSHLAYLSTKSIDLHSSNTSPPRKETVLNTSTGSESTALKALPRSVFANGAANSGARNAVTIATEERIEESRCRGRGIMS